MKKMITLLLILTVLGISASANVTGLYNTGVDSNGNPLGNMTQDLHYVLTSYPTPPTNITYDYTYAIDRHPNWVNPGSDAMWVGPTAYGVTDSVGDFVYELTFNISSAPSNVTLSTFTQASISYKSGVVVVIEFASIEATV